MRLAVDTHKLTLAVASALRTARFAQVTVLEEPPAEGASAPARHDRLLLDQARAAGADMVLLCSVSYDPVIWRRENSNFWLTWPLFLLGGPFMYFLEDHTYLVECELDGGIYDLNALDPVEPRLGDRFARIMGTTVKFQGVPLDFIDRADDVGDYALSLICPSGYLAKESEDLQQEFQGQVVDNLALQIADALKNRSDDLFRPDGIVPFWVEPGEVTVAWSAEQGLVVAGVVHLDLTSQVEVMSQFTLRAGGEVVEGAFGSGQLDLLSGGGGDSRSYEFRLAVALAAPPQSIQLELEAGDREVFRRSYTFPVATSAAAEPEQ